MAALETFAWDMGGRLYSIGARSYRLTASKIERGSPLTANLLLNSMCKPRTIFQALRGGALDVYSDGEPYWIEDSAGRVIPRELVSRRR